MRIIRACIAELQMTTYCWMDAVWRWWQSGIFHGLILLQVSD